MKKIKAALICVFLGFYPVLSKAVPDFTLHGFGSAGAAYSGTRDATAFSYGMNNATRRVNFQGPSRLGLNYSGELTEKFSFNVQLLGKGGDVVRPYSILLEWAQVNYQPFD